MSRLTYEDVFYRKYIPRSARNRERERERESIRISDANGELVYCTQDKCHQRIYGFPISMGGWCHELKRGALAKSNFSAKPANDGRNINVIHYIGIAADEPIRIKRHIDKPDKVLPLVQIGWDEGLCGLIAQYLDMLAPTYTTSLRDGCWFCHNQGVDQLRNLRHNYPELWALLMKWDTDSPVTFHSDGRTVHDYDRRFQMEDEGRLISTNRFLWKYLDDPPEIKENE